MESVEWIAELSDENLLAVYDVALDIRDELQIDDDVVIPIYRQVVRFATLCPASSIGLIDRYCEFRWKATVLLKRRGVVDDFDVIKDLPRWNNKLRLRLNKDLFPAHFQAIEAAYQSRFKARTDADGSLSQAVSNVLFSTWTAALSRSCKDKGVAS